MCTNSTFSINTHCLKLYGLQAEIDKLCSICWSEPLKTTMYGVYSFLLLFLAAFYNARLSVVNVTQMCLETPVMCNNCKPLYLLPALINHSSSQRNGCGHYQNGACLGRSETETSGTSHHTGWYSLASPHLHDFLSLINAMLTWHK